MLVFRLSDRHATPSTRLDINEFEGVPVAMTARSV